MKIERHIEGINENFHQTGAWIINTITGKGDPGLTIHALSPNDKKIRGSSYSFNNKFTKLKSPDGTSIVFQPKTIEPTTPRQLFPQSPVKASA